MKTTFIKPLVAALLLAGTCAAHAAHLEVITYDTPSTAYAGLLGSSLFSEAGSDISGGGDVAALGSSAFDNGTTAHGYAADAFFSSGSSLLVTTTQYLDSAKGVYFGSALATLPSITLKVVADAGDIGSTVNISFSGLSSTFLTGSSGTLAMDLSVSNGSTVLGSYQRNLIGDDEAISFAFQAQAGDLLTLSASVATNMTAIGQAGNIVGGQLGGEFAVAAVPEPEQYAMLLAGLGLIGAIARRRAPR